MPKEAKKRLARMLIAAGIVLAGTATNCVLQIKFPIYIFAYIIAYFVVGGRVIAAAIKKVKSGNAISEDFLITIITVAAIYTGKYALAIAVLLIYELGELFFFLASTPEQKHFATKPYATAMVTLSVAIIIIPPTLKVLYNTIIFLCVLLTCVSLILKIVVFLKAKRQKK